MINLTSTYILRRLADEDIHAFRVSEFRRLFGVDVRRAYQILLRLESRGLLERFAKGRYVVVGVGHSEPASNAFFLATRVVEPSYVSFWSALNYYAWTEQVPRVVMVANTRRTGLRRVGPFRAKFVRLRPARFFGYQLERMGNLDIPFAEPEKAILDSLFLPECAGGIDEVAKSISEAVPE